MSVTQDYKTVTFLGMEAFAVARALRGRIDVLGDMIADAMGVRDDVAAEYLRNQRRAAEQALAAVSDAPLTRGQQGAKS